PAARTLAHNPATQHERRFPAKASAPATQAQSKLPLAVSSFPLPPRHGALFHLQSKLFREALCLQAQQRLASAVPVPRAEALPQESRERRCRQKRALLQSLVVCPQFVC